MAHKINWPARRARWAAWKQQQQQPVPLRQRDRDALQVIRAKEASGYYDAPLPPPCPHCGNDLTYRGHKAFCPKEEKP